GSKRLTPHANQKIGAELVPLQDALHLIDEGHRRMRLFLGFRVPRFLSYPHELAPEIPQTDGDWRRRLVAEVVGDGRMRLFDVADERRRLPWSVHLDGGGALSGRSNWS